MKARRLETAARGALIAWTALTCLYAVVCLVPFAWVGVIEPKFYPAWVGIFLSAHAALTTAVMGLASVTLVKRDWKSLGWPRLLWLLGAAVAAAISWALPLRSLTPGGVAFAVAVGATLPLAAWEALIARPRVGRLPWDAPLGVDGACARLVAAAGAGILCALASSLPLLGSEGWTPAQVSVVAAASASQHALLFAFAAALLEAARRAASLARRPQAALALAETILVALLLRGVVARLIFDAVAFRGFRAEAVAWAWALAATSVWAGQALSRRAARPEESGEFLLALAGARWPTTARVAALGIVAAAPAALAALLAGRDWNGMLLMLAMGAVWIVAFAASRPVAHARGGDRRAMAVATALIATAWLGAAAACELDLVLRLRDLAPAALAARATPQDPSLRLARRAALRPGGITFFETLRRNTNLSREELIAPRRIDLVERVRAGEAPKPHVFILVVDSLRQDYLGAYNAKVSFTPALDAFAREGLVWKKAFTVYGATGLSEPSIWSGSLLIHQQYVTPFAPMNGLERLLDALNYRKLITLDVILKALLTPDPDLRELDKDTVGFYAFCDSLRDVEAKLDAAQAGRPMFVYTQPQDVHVAAINRAGRDNVTGKAYSGFEAPYASRVERMDACFGKFVAALKRRGLYDHSVIVLTSDHGDSLGEQGRWGHAYTIFPEILRVPLIMRLPPALAKRARVDLTGPAFLIDIAPTLHQALGQGPPRLDPLLGRPLLSLDGRDPAAWRKPEQLVASSYGPAYGVLRDGRHLYIADGVNFRHYQFDLARDPEGQRNVLTPAAQAEGERAVLDWIKKLNDFWGRSSESDP